MCTSGHQLSCRLILPLWKHHWTAAEIGQELEWACLQMVYQQQNIIVFPFQKVKLSETLEEGVDL